MNLSNHLLCAAARKKTLTYIGNTPKTSNETIYTFTGASIGTAAGDRRVIASITASGGASGTTIDTVTIGGVTATLSTSRFNGTMSAIHAIALVPTGTTADIVVTHSGAKSRCTVGVYSVTGLTASAFYADDAAYGTDGTDPMAISISSLIGGYVIANRETTDNTSATWTTLTERWDTPIESGAATTTGASLLCTGTTTTGSLSFSAGVGSGSCVSI